MSELGTFVGMWWTKTLSALPLGAFHSCWCRPQCNISMHGLLWSFGKKIVAEEKNHIYIVTLGWLAYTFQFLSHRSAHIPSFGRPQKNLSCSVWRELTLTLLLRNFECQYSWVHDKHWDWCLNLFGDSYCKFSNVNIYDVKNIPQVVLQVLNRLYCMSICSSA